MSHDDLWADDLLGRKQDADFLIRFLEARVAERRDQGKTASYVLNIDAPWGAGKTFFLTRLHQQLEKDGHVVAHINAWETDAYGEPFTSVLAGMEEALHPWIRKHKALQRMWQTVVAAGGQVMASVVKGATRQLAKKLIGDAIDDVAEIHHSLSASEPIKDSGRSASADQASSSEKNTENLVVADAAESVANFTDALMQKQLYTFRQHNNSVKTFKERIARLTPVLRSTRHERALMFVLVDELDRCRPSYAVSMLEEIKHLFNVDGVVFIVATDTMQLEKSICAIYGTGFDGGRYLLRFFNRRFMFAEPNIVEFTEALFVSTGIDKAKLSSPPSNSHESFLSQTVTAFGLQLRDAEQCFDILSSLCTIWEQRVRIEMIYMLPLIILYQQGKMREFQQLTRGEEVTFNWVTDWQIRFLTRDGFGRPTQPDEVSALELIRSFRRLMNAKVNDLYESSSKRVHDRWMRDRLREEFQVRFSNTQTSGEVPEWLVHAYPQMIQSAGRLVVNAVSR